MCLKEVKFPTHIFYWNKNIMLFYIMLLDKGET